MGGAIVLLVIVAVVVIAVMEQVEMNNRPTNMKSLARALRELEAMHEARKNYLRSQPDLTELQWARRGGRPKPPIYTTDAWISFSLYLESVSEYGSVQLTRTDSEGRNRISISAHFANLDEAADFYPGYLYTVGGNPFAKDNEYNGRAYFDLLNATINGVELSWCHVSG